MVKKHMKKCSPSLAIKEKQIKTMLRVHLTPIRMNSYHQEHHHQQMLARMWGKRNPPTAASTTTLEKNMELKKTRSAI
jgi:hypothetical protein